MKLNDLKAAIARSSDVGAGSQRLFLGTDELVDTGADLGELLSGYTHEQGLMLVRDVLVEAGPDGVGDGTLPFLAIGRVEDCTILARCVHSNAGAFEGVFKKIIAASTVRLTPGAHIRLQWNEGSLVCLLDERGEIVYCVVTKSLGYPEERAVTLLRDLAEVATSEPELATAPKDGLKLRLGPKMRELVLRYEDDQNFLGAPEAGSFAVEASPRHSPARLATRKDVLVLVGILAILGALIFLFVLARRSSTALAEAAESFSPTLFAARRVGWVGGGSPW